MKEFVEKLIGRLEEEYINCFTTGDYKYNNAIDKAKEIVNELAEEYKDAEKQGLLLRLPCKVGDTVYSVVKDGLSIFELEFSLDFYVRRKDDFGKTIFLTREEAEQALAEMKGV